VFVRAMLCGLMSASICSAAAPGVYPRRVINQQSVDLLPLFVWWDHQRGVRPLTAWKHLQGVLQQETVYGWVVRGYIEGQSGLQYFLLKNPPRKELARYRELEGQLPQLEREKASKLAVAKLPAYKTHSLGRYSSSDGSVDGGAITLPTEDFDRIQQAKNELHEIDAQTSAIRDEMASMLTKRGYFKVDAFALQADQVYQGYSVFDFGYPPY